MAAADPDRWVVIDGSGSVEDVAAQIGRVVDAILGRSGIHGMAEDRAR